MTPGERLKQWIDGLAQDWGDRLRGWMVRWTVGGITDALEDMTPEQKASIETMAQKLIDDENVPEFMKGYLRLATKRGNPLFLVIGILMAVAMVWGTVEGLAKPLGNILTHKEERLLRTFRLDPGSVITAWRRDPAKYAWVFDDLKDMGWPDRSIETLKDITQVIPNAADIVRFALREVYDTKIAKEYGQFQDIPSGAYPDAARAGLSEDMFNKYWAAHWGLPSASDGFELLHRGILNEDQLKGLLKANDIMPYWRDQLIKLSWNIPTRVDVRRFWDMRTIDEQRLREIYTGLGYHGQDLEDYVLWTKIYVDFPDLLARYKNGWITLEQVKTELVAMGMKPDRADTMIQEKMKNAMIERTVTEKNITKADIVNGVKKGVITRAEGNTLLVSIGYSTDEATFILEVGIPTDEEDANTKVRTLTKSDIAAAVKERLLSPAEAITKLIALRYKEADATFLAAIYAAQIPIEKVETERELTKGDIAAGLKAGIISPEEARVMLTELRYSAEDAEFLVSANMPDAVALAAEKKRQVDKGDIRSALRAGIITDADAISRLVKLQYTEADASFLVYLYNTIDSLSIVTRPKEASKADIVTAVKKGLITASEGYTMLVGLGFSADASNFILSLVAEESPFSPMNYGEFQALTNKWKAATNIGGKPMTEEIKTLGSEVIRLSAEVDTLQRSIRAERGTLVAAEVLPAAATARLRELQAALYKAQAELTRMQSAYNAKVVEWRRGV